MRYSFLSLVGLNFFAAFLSYYVQYPGLLSSASGIIPADRALSSIFSEDLLRNKMFSWIHDDVDSFSDLIVMLGVILSVFATL